MSPPVSGSLVVRQVVIRYAKGKPECTIELQASTNTDTSGTGPIINSFSVGCMAYDVGFRNAFLV